MAKQPVVKFRVGFVTATVWLNDRFYSTVLSKSCKDGDEYKDTDQLVLERAESFIADQV